MPHTPTGTIRYACGCQTHTLDVNGIGPALEHCPTHAAAPEMLAVIQNQALRRCLNEKVCRADCDPCVSRALLTKIQCVTS